MILYHFRQGSDKKNKSKLSIKSCLIKEKPPARFAHSSRKARKEKHCDRRVTALTTGLHPLRGICDI